MSWLNHSPVYECLVVFNCGSTYQGGKRNEECYALHSGKGEAVTWFTDNKAYVTYQRFDDGKVHMIVIGRYT